MAFRRYRKTKTTLCACLALITIIWFLQHEQGDSKDQSTFNIQSHSRCQEKVNFVYLKMIKCASETLTSLFHSFGYQRKLTFVLPLETRIYVGWPYSIQKNHFRPLKSDNFNILCEHFVFNESMVKSIMPNNTIYLTSIREPYTQFKSTFNYYKIGKLSGLDNSADSLSKYLKNVEKYDAIYQSHSSAKERYCIPDNFTMTKNLMSFNLGMPQGYPSGSGDISNNKSAVQEYIKHLDEVFHLVMIVEYMQESLILLKRLMCWKSYKSILYRSKNMAQYKYKSENNPDDIRLYKKRSQIDYYLYDYFNKTFWHKVSQQSNYFTQEVSFYSKLLKDFNSFCDEVQNKNVPVSDLVYQESRWSTALTITKLDCTIAGYENEWYKVLKSDYDHMSGKVQMPTNVPYFC